LYSLRGVTGEKCDKCLPLTFGFDPIIGCVDCDCEPHGVYNRDLQCDVDTGVCNCKRNVVGRTCNKCKPGLSLNSHFFRYIQNLLNKFCVTLDSFCFAKL
jgi:hypothetical protein